MLLKKAPKSFHKSLPMKLWKIESKISMEFIELELNFSCLKLVYQLHRRDTIIWRWYSFIASKAWFHLDIQIYQII